MEVCGILENKEVLKMKWVVRIEIFCIYFLIVSQIQKLYYKNDFVNFIIANIMFWLSVEVEEE